MVDFGPRGDFKVTTYVAYNNISTSFSGTSILTMEKDLKTAMEKDRKTAEDTPGFKAKDKAVQNWCSTYVKGAKCSKIIEAVRDRSIVQPSYEKLAEQYRQHKVKQIIMLTCNLGNAPQLLDEISTDFQVPVGGYKYRVVSIVVGGKVRMVLAKNKTILKSTNTARAETEIPRIDQGTYYLGRVIGPYSERRIAPSTPALPPRIPTVPPSAPSPHL